MFAHLNRQQLQWKWRVLIGILLVLNVVQTISLVRRVTRGVTDFTVFFNTAKELGNGAGAELYMVRDTSTDWLRTIPPFGQMVIQPFAFGDVKTASILWGIVNLLLLAAGVLTLGYFAGRLDAKSRLFAAALPAMTAVWLALAQGSIQVGQYSVLFAAFWIFFLGLRASRYSRFASAALAVPAGIKLYPVILPGIFLLQRRPKAFAVSMLFVVLTFALPFVAYGGRTAELTKSFWDNAISSSSDSSRISESQRANSVNNQGLDSILLRYLTTGQKLHKRNPGFPHLALERPVVIRLTNALRLLILVLTAVAAWRAWSRLEKTPLWGTFLLLALACACLYVLIPGTKSRYAIYTFLAFVPIIIQAVAAQKLGRTRAFWGWSAATVVLLLLCMQFTPSEFRLYGINFSGHLALWCVNLALIWRVGSSRRGSETEMLGLS
jgi:hypothetical protein